MRLATYVDGGAVMDCKGMVVGEGIPLRGVCRGVCEGGYVDYGMRRGECEMWEDHLGRVVGAAKWKAVVLEGRERGCVCGEGCGGFGECVGRLGEWYGVLGKGEEGCVDGEWCNSGEMRGFHFAEEYQAMLPRSAPPQVSHSPSQKPHA